MALYCTACQTTVNATGAVCPNCRNGFVSALACKSCNRVVVKGQSWCSHCDSVPAEVGAPTYSGETGRQQPRDSSGSLVPRGAVPHLPPPMVHLPLGRSGVPGLPFGMPSAVPEVYNHGRFGVDAEVTMNGRDAEILTKMGQVSALLYAIAQEMNSLQGFMPSTRDCIKDSRILAMKLQEEIEVRRGPQG